MGVPWGLPCPDPFFLLPSCWGEPSAPRILSTTAPCLTSGHGCGDGRQGTPELRATVNPSLSKLLFQVFCHSYDKRTHHGRFERCGPPS